MAMNICFIKNHSLIKINYIKYYKKFLSEIPTFNDFLQDYKNSQCLVRKKGETLHLPPWLKTSIPTGKGYFEITEQLKNSKIATVCQEAKCPNIGECWNDKKNIPKTATIMILGDTCTRGCRFCSVKTSKKPDPPNLNEPEEIAEAIKSWGIGYTVITCVDRDDLPDGGSQHMANVVKAVKLKIPKILIECLVSDYGGNLESIKTVANSGLEVFAHNIETVERLTPFVRDPRAKYNQSLYVLKNAKFINKNLITKSSIMVGFGEENEEVIKTMKDLRENDVDCLTIGQYIQPTKNHTKVKEYIKPEIFNEWEQIGLKMGFKYVASGPLVRSSYRAGEFYIQKILQS